MAAQVLSGISNLWLPNYSMANIGPPTVLDVVADAANEGCQLTGQVWLPARSGSKTISSAGGKIHWTAGASVVFADGATNWRMGIQDLSTSGQPPRGDGVFDVQADLVPGVDTIATTTHYATAMESGSKTITHGDYVAIVFSMTARGGTDAVRVRSATPTWRNDRRQVQHSPVQYGRPVHAGEFTGRLGLRGQQHNANHGGHYAHGRFRWRDGLA